MELGGGLALHLAIEDIAYGGACQLCKLWKLGLWCPGLEVGLEAVQNAARWRLLPVCETVKHCCGLDDEVGCRPLVPNTAEARMQPTSDRRAP